MTKKNLLNSLLLASFIFVLQSFYPQKKNKTDFSESVKIILRAVGNQLLLIQGDSTSLILPVKEIKEGKYEVSFQKELTFEPHELVKIVKLNFEKSSLSNNYRVEVIQCTDDEVAYSYEINADEEKTIIPCSGRKLPKNCYLIQVHFLEEVKSNDLTLYYIFIPLILGFFYREFILNKKKGNSTSNHKVNEQVLGSFFFYPDQNKLVKKAVEINLSKKECELLAIFIANKNKVVKREEITKKVWEDNGVFVGRSLDTYISKLRKKLQEDKNIKLTNIHGVGYKLEVK
ncbi:winged helix-turn-helix domain-containing protein [Polaribacter sp. R77954]|uniref:winged helix-turn-helix domain-containing protein n=1 Tax=Polaribacter sp. R77954 TaxID=3093870 RepID=UPI0037C5FC16